MPARQRTARRHLGLASCLAAADRAAAGPRIEFTGTVEVIASDMWVVGGRTVAVTAATEIKPGLAIGMLAKVHAVPQANGSLWAREIEPADGDDDGNGNSNGNGNDRMTTMGMATAIRTTTTATVNSNDDNGNDDDGNGELERRQWQRRRRQRQCELERRQWQRR